MTELFSKNLKIPKDSLDYFTKIGFGNKNKNKYKLTQWEGGFA